MFDKSQSAYREFRDIVAERTNRVVAWVGAGLSMPAGLPSWPALRTALCKELEQRIHVLDSRDPKFQLLTARLATARAESLWVAFQILQEALGITTYRATIRQALETATLSTVPEDYLHLWSLHLGGMISLNLDNLASRSFAQFSPGNVIPDFTSSTVGDNLHLLRSSKPFIAHLHGKVSEVSSWVFTHNELNTLMANAAYKQFVNAIASTRTILFIGISAEDVAVGGHLQRLRELGVDFGHHFWITHRNDSSTFDWAEKAGIRVISYKAIENNHSELREFFQDLQAFVPSDTPAQPVVMNIPSVGVLRSPSDLRTTESTEKVRELLNAHAAKILITEPEKYDQFCDDYDEAIYRAWYVGPRPAGQTILTYKIEEQIARGAFGRVFRAQGPDGKEVALKLLHEEVRHSKAKLDAFRRGVRAMQILSDRKVPGMVPYLAASEIPALAVMEFVDGPDLSSAVLAGQIDDWSLVLRIAKDLVRIVRSAHLLPERVLHRDIRPPNIMLRGFYSDHDNWDLVVLDFDLSWHRDAMGQSVVADTLHGYLAPEQVSAESGASTRNAVVDSFGIGMTIYFLLTGQTPIFGQQRSQNWEKDIVDRVRLRPSAWASLPRRLARLIAGATTNDQANRFDLSQIGGEIEALTQAVEHPGAVISAELLAEEIAARALVDGYAWDQDKLEAVRSSASGLEIHISSNEREHDVRLRMTWQSSGEHENRRVNKWVADAGARAASKLKKAGWKTDVSYEQLSLTITAEVEVASAATKMTALVGGVVVAAEQLRFA